MRNSIIYLLLVCSFCLVSCNSDEKFQASDTNISLPKGKKTKAIQLNTSYWSIVEILNIDGSVMKGDIYRDMTHSQPAESNTPLALKESDEGMLKMNSLHSGFTIEKNLYSKTLQLVLNENFSIHPFSFVIVLKSGDEIQKITVT
jgi:hypothetical protein